MDAAPARSPFAAVLFDMDGVLLFSEDAWFSVYNDTLLHFGHERVSRESFDAIYGNGTEADRDTYMPERSVEEVDEAYRRFFGERLSEVRVNPEAGPALTALRRRGIGIAVATNTNRELAARLLENASLAPLLDVLAAADEAGAGKPDPAVVRLAAARLGVPLEHALFVGDSRYDEGAARAAPVRFLGYRYGEAERIASLDELAGLVERAFAGTP